jgi:hypothetical protein
MRSGLHQLPRHLEQPQPAHNAKLPSVREAPDLQADRTIQPDRDQHRLIVPAAGVGNIGHLTDAFALALAQRGRGLPSTVRPTQSDQAGGLRPP